MKLTAQRVREVLDYDPKSGLFTWRVRKARRVQIGDIAGSINKIHNRRMIKLDGVKYRASRLAWLWMTEEWPPKGYEVDHKDGNSLNDRWRNLRLATHSQNICNARRRSDNSLGFKGVTRHRNKFRAYISRNGQQIVLGSFDTPELAHRAYKWAARRHYGEFARTE